MTSENYNDLTYDRKGQNRPIRPKILKLTEVSMPNRNRKKNKLKVKDRSQSNVRDRIYDDPAYTEDISHLALPLRRNSGPDKIDVSQTNQQKKKSLAKDLIQFSKRSLTETSNYQQQEFSSSDDDIVPDSGSSKHRRGQSLERPIITEKSTKKREKRDRTAKQKRNLSLDNTLSSDLRRSSDKSDTSLKTGSIEREKPKHKSIQRQNASEGWSSCLAATSDSSRATENDEQISSNKEMTKMQIGKRLLKGEIGIKSFNYYLLKEGLKSSKKLVDKQKNSTGQNDIKKYHSKSEENIYEEIFFNDKNSDTEEQSKYPDCELCIQQCTRENCEYCLEDFQNRQNFGSLGRNKRQSNRQHGNGDNLIGSEMPTAHILQYQSYNPNNPGVYKIETTPVAFTSDYNPIHQLSVDNQQQLSAYQQRRNSRGTVQTGTGVRVNAKSSSSSDSLHHTKYVRDRKPQEFYEYNHPIIYGGPEPMTSCDQKIYKSDSKVSIISEYSARSESSNRNFRCGEVSDSSLGDSMFSYSTQRKYFGSSESCRFAFECRRCSLDGEKCSFSDTCRYECRNCDCSSSYFSSDFDDLNYSRKSSTRLSNSSQKSYEYYNDTAEVKQSQYAQEFIKHVNDVKRSICQSESQKGSTHYVDPYSTIPLPKQTDVKKSISHYQQPRQYQKHQQQQQQQHQQHKSVRSRGSPFKSTQSSSLGSYISPMAAKDSNLNRNNKNTGAGIVRVPNTINNESSVKNLQLEKEMSQKNCLVYATNEIKYAKNDTNLCYRNNEGEYESGNKNQTEHSSQKKQTGAIPKLSSSASNGSPQSARYQKVIAKENTQKISITINKSPYASPSSRHKTNINKETIQLSSKQTSRSPILEQSVRKLKQTSPNKGGNENIQNTIPTKEQQQHYTYQDNHKSHWINLEEKNTQKNNNGFIDNTNDIISKNVNDKKYIQKIDSNAKEHKTIITIPIQNQIENSIVEIKMKNIQKPSNRSDCENDDDDDEVFIIEKKFDKNFQMKTRRQRAFAVTVSPITSVQNNSNKDTSFFSASNDVKSNFSFQSPPITSSSTIITHTKNIVSTTSTASTTISEDSSSIPDMDNAYKDAINPPKATTPTTTTTTVTTPDKMKASHQKSSTIISTVTTSPANSTSPLSTTSSTSLSTKLIKQQTVDSANKQFHIRSKSDVTTNESSTVNDTTNGSGCAPVLTKNTKAAIGEGSSVNSITSAITSSSNVDIAVSCSLNSRELHDDDGKATVVKLKTAAETTTLTTSTTSTTAISNTAAASTITAATTTASTTSISITTAIADAATVSQNEIIFVDKTSSRDRESNIAGATNNRNQNSELDKKYTDLSDSLSGNNNNNFSSINENTKFNEISKTSKDLTNKVDISDLPLPALPPKKRKSKDRHRQQQQHKQNEQNLSRTKKNHNENLKEKLSECDHNQSQQHTTNTGKIRESLETPSKTFLEKLELKKMHYHSLGGRTNTGTTNTIGKPTYLFGENRLSGNKNKNSNTDEIYLNKSGWVQVSSKRSNDENSSAINNRKTNLLRSDSQNVKNTIRVIQIDKGTKDRTTIYATPKISSNKIDELISRNEARRNNSISNRGGYMKPGFKIIDPQIASILNERPGFLPVKTFMENDSPPPITPILSPPPAFQDAKIRSKKDVNDSKKDTLKFEQKGGKGMVFSRSFEYDRKQVDYADTFSKSFDCNLSDEKSDEIERTYICNFSTLTGSSPNYLSRKDGASKSRDNSPKYQQTGPNFYSTGTTITNESPAYINPRKLDKIGRTSLDRDARSRKAQFSRINPNTPTNTSRFRSFDTNISQRLNSCDSGARSDLSNDEVDDDDDNSSNQFLSANSSFKQQKSRSLTPEKYDSHSSQGSLRKQRSLTPESRSLTPEDRRKKGSQVSLSSRQNSGSRSNTLERKQKFENRSHSPSRSSSSSSYNENDLEMTISHRRSAVRNSKTSEEHRIRRSRSLQLAERSPNRTLSGHKAVICGSQIPVSNQQSIYQQPARNFPPTIRPSQILSDSLTNNRILRQSDIDKSHSFDLDYGAFRNQDTSGRTDFDKSRSFDEDYREHSSAVRYITDTGIIREDPSIYKQNSQRSSGIGRQTSPQNYGTRLCDHELTYDMLRRTLDRSPIMNFSRDYDVPRPIKCREVINYDSSELNFLNERIYDHGKKLRNQSPSDSTTYSMDRTKSRDNLTPDSEIKMMKDALTTASEDRLRSDFIYRQPLKGQQPQLIQHQQRKTVIEHPHQTLTGSSAPTRGSYTTSSCDFWPHCGISDLKFKKSSSVDHQKYSSATYDSTTAIENFSNDYDDDDNDDDFFNVQKNKDQFNSSVNNRYPFLSKYNEPRPKYRKSYSLNETTKSCKPITTPINTISIATENKKIKTKPPIYFNPGNNEFKTSTGSSTSTVIFLGKREMPITREKNSSISNLRQNSVTIDGRRFNKPITTQPLSNGNNDIKLSRSTISKPKISVLNRKLRSVSLPNLFLQTE